MKRKIALILAGVMLMLAPGCNFRYSFHTNAVDVEEISKEDIFADIEGTDIDNGEAAETFATAMNNVNSENNVTIYVDNNITMGTEGQTDYQESINKTEVKINKAEESADADSEGTESTGNVYIENVYKYMPNAGTEGTTGSGSDELTEEKNAITGYYSGDRLYFITNDGDKVQEEMSYDDFLAVVNTYTLSLFDECISKVVSVEDGDERTYYIAYDPQSFETTMNTNMEASGQSLGEGEAMDVKYANIAARFDSEDNLVGYGFVISAEYITDAGTTPYNYSLVADFMSRGDTKTEAPDDMDAYMTADEYTQMMQERYSEGSSETGDTAEYAGTAEETEAAASEEETVGMAEGADAQ